MSNHSATSPWVRLFRLIRLDFFDLSVLLSYNLVSALLVLATPLAAQALINSIAAGMFLQPVVVLTALLFLGLALASLLGMLQLALVELLKQRVLARTTLRLSQRLPYASLLTFQRTNPAELLNRFFDVLTLQKAASKILLDCPQAMLQVLVGLVLLAFYHPYLLLYGVALVIGMLLVFLLGFGGLSSSIRTSARKYKVAGWLEELGRCQLAFKMAPGSPLAERQADRLVVDYIRERRRHFFVLLRQWAAHYAVYTLGSAGILGLGGWLVIHRGLTLGQLVAAELVVLSCLKAFEKIVYSLPSLYDLLTALDKLSVIEELPLERTDGKPVLATFDGPVLECRQVAYHYAEGFSLRNVSLRLERGLFVSLVGPNGSGKSTMLELIAGLLEPSQGLLLVQGVDVRDACLSSLRRVAVLVGQTQDLFEGTVEENILVGRELDQVDLLWALELTRLDRDLALTRDGLKTCLVSEGRNLSRGMRQKVLLARAVVGRPALLLLDEALTSIDERDRMAILQAMDPQKNRWTVLNVTHEPWSMMVSDRLYVLEAGQIGQEGGFEELINQSDGLLAQLHPELTARWRED
ncbi:ABC transporter ATP-binding protein [bacterium CPR1]|nr:ABC transporter ATP-binding protein [bacterium CPR1]